MSKISIEIFGKDCETVTYKQDGEPMLIFEFADELDGYIALGSATARIKGRSCAVDLRRLKDGEYIPHLVLMDSTLDLPTVIKQHGIIAIKEPEISYLTRLSLRERRLGERVERLERAIENIEKKVMGQSLFGGEP